MTDDPLKVGPPRNFGIMSLPKALVGLRRFYKTLHGKVAIWSGALVILFWLLVPAIVPNLPHPANGAGLFGDMYGVLNALFSGLAFVGLIVAILMQREELELQREELKATREELAGSREQMELQNSTISLQRAENTFFQLIRLFQDIVESLDSGQPGLTNRKAFNYYLSKYQNDRSGSSIEESSREFFQKYDIHIGHYFRSLENILMFLDDSPVFVDKNVYKRIIMSLLSKNEKKMIYYYGLTTIGVSFKPLIERYGVLKGLVAEDFKDRPKDWAGQYSDSAFQ